MNKILEIGTPTKNVNCQAQCTSNLGPTDALTPLAPRKNREKVRGQIKDYVLLMLGAPVINIELDEQQLDGAVDFSLQIIEDYAPREYFQWYVFSTVPGQTIYKMPDDVGMIRQVAYKETGQLAFSAADLGGVIPLEYMGAGAYGSIAGGINPQTPVWGKMNEWVLYKQYEDMYNRAAGQQGGWEWIEGYSNIKLYPTPYKSHLVAVHYLQKRPDFKEVTQSMQEGALAFAKIMVGRIRSKIMNPPGPNGGIQLDGQQILQEGLQEKKEWEERLITRFGDLPSITLG
jgi:hypothetical protein